MKLILLSTLLCIATLANGQSQLIDSLIEITQTSEDDSIVVRAYSKWNVQVYRSDRNLSLEITSKIDSICAYQLSQNLSPSRRNYFKNIKGNSRYNAGVIYEKQSRYDQAIIAHKENLRLKKELNDYPYVTKAYFRLANIYRRTSRYDSAIYLFKETIRYAELANDRRVKIFSLNNIGIIHRYRAQFDSSLYYYEKGLSIVEESNDTLGMAVSYINIGNVHYMRGDLDSAAYYYRESEVRREWLKDTSGMGNVLTNLAAVYKSKGDYPKSLEYAREALRMKQATQDREGIANLISNIANTYKSQGDYDRAEQEYFKSLFIYEDLNDKKGIADVYSQISGLYRRMGRMEDAREYTVNSIKINKEIGHVIGLQDAYHDAGQFYALSGNTRLGLTYLDSSFALIKDNVKALIDHYHTKGELYKMLGDSIYNIGEIGWAKDYYDSSTYYLERARIEANKFGLHNSIGDILKSEYQTYRSRDLPAKQAEFLIKLEEIRRKEAGIHFPVLSEAEKEMYFKTIKGDFEVIFDYLALNEDANDDLLNLGFNTSLLMKGILLKSASNMKNAIINSGDQHLLEQYNEWVALKRRIVENQSDGKNTDQLEQQSNLLEKELVEGSEEFSKIRHVLDNDWKELQKELEEGEVLVDFLRFNHRPDPYIDTSSIVYGAFVISKDSENPKFVKLFDELKLEELISKYSGADLTYVNDVYGTKKKRSAELYNLIWKPLEPFIGGREQAYISLAGLLHKISISALADDEGEYLSDKIDIRLLSSPNVLLEASSSLSEEHQVLLVGGVDYGQSESKKAWDYLDGTKDEIERIEKHLSKAKQSNLVLAGGAASEESFKEYAQEYSIIHVATHGFFYPDPDDFMNYIHDDEESDQELKFRGKRDGPLMLHFTQNRNPFLRSGLVLANANEAWTSTESKRLQDGILTAAEVATLDLRQAELVVLSACETGLGDIRGSEGVYGLQRAFKMGGARKMIMSLWQVPDKETAEFMSTFYKKLLKGGEIHQAFIETQRAMQEKYDPYFWAAFVLVE